MGGVGALIGLIYLKYNEIEESKVFISLAPRQAQCHCSFTVIAEPRSQRHQPRFRSDSPVPLLLHSSDQVQLFNYNCSSLSSSACAACWNRQQSHSSETPSSAVSRAGVLSQSSNCFHSSLWPWDGNALPYALDARASSFFCESWSRSFSWPCKLLCLTLSDFDRSLSGDITSTRHPGNKSLPILNQASSPSKLLSRI